ncbi:P-loop NTPase fold protein [Roseateles terrae]|uniref:KAP NTPase domain-containing protein n=1 Tax=Roseateles terrae TaxID=431060 RepID=A0ABR6GXN4_9BURK|nr:P-loop NTPase fold protein [Roseateles terrae]MBB3196871.1 hypothetical protein [Roseateles terrae]OWQ84576.1 NTPase KAP [Roseateles terrae]
MSLEKTKEQLLKQLKNNDNKVIALSGNWGTGKTHLWNDVRAKSDDEKIRKAFYVSLFGLSSVEQIKRKLCESAIPGADSHGGMFDSVKKLMGAGVKALAQHYKAVAALNDLNIVLMAPVLLRGAVIVIDDIERKHEKLGIDEVLGFIDEYSKEFGCRFVLVLNDDQLSAKGDQEKLWSTFREKVIDQEIRLTTSPDEALAIALSIAPSKYAAELQKAVKTCGLNNIRIITKVIRVANQILAGRDLEDAIQARVVPSIVLFSAIHYRGLHDGPDFKFALNAGSRDWSSFTKEAKQERTPQQEKEAGWRLLMQGLGILGCDEFESCLVDFLQSGLFEMEAIDAIIERYEREKDAMVAREEAHHFITRCIWDHRTSEEELLAVAQQFRTSAKLLDPYIVSELQLSLSKMAAGIDLGEALIDGWVENFKATQATSVKDSNPFGKPLHEKIKTLFSEIKANEQMNATVVDACLHVVEHRGWGPLQEIALQRATAADFEAAIRNIEDLEALGRFMRQMIEMGLHREAYDKHFGSAADCFMAACRSICADASSPRLANLIHWLFDDTVLASELDGQSAGVTGPGAQQVAHE